MKRVSEIVEGGGANESLGFKRVRFFDEINENCGTSGTNEDEQEGVIVENAGMDFAPADRTNECFENTFFDDLDAGGLKEYIGADFDIDFSSIFGNGEQQKSLGFDLNVPLDSGMEMGCSKYAQGPIIVDIASDDSPLDSGMEMGCSKYAQGPIIVDIASDDSDSDVEVIGFNMGYNAKGKQIELGIPDDRIENLSLGLGMIRMDNNAVGGSSLGTIGDRRYTWEEKGKATVVDSTVVDSWLSLKASDSIVVGLESDSDSASRVVGPVEDDVEVDIERPELAAPRELRQAEELRQRDRLRQSWRETAKQYARDLLDKNKGNESVRAIEQLGKSSGPFGEALNMVRERTSKRSAKPLIEWKPKQENQVHRPVVPSLLDLAVKALAGNAEGLVSLELIPDNLRRRLADVLCDISKMNVRILELLVEGCPTEIRIKNCSWLTENQFQQTFGRCQTKDLMVLQLDLCGQLMLDIVFGQTLSQPSSSFSSLAIVSLRGACRLSDSGLKDLVNSAPSLQSLNLGQCTLLTSEAINLIADSLGSNLKELYIDHCPKINAKLILPAFKKFKCLELLSVAGLRTITDQFISEMSTVCGRSIKELDLDNCLDLTDLSLKYIGSNCTDLLSLNISNLGNLTDLAMEYLANGCKSIRKLKLCRNGFSDEAMAAFLESSGEHLTELLLNNLTRVGPHTALSLARRSTKLLSLDISWCRKISNEALGLIVDSCSSLKLLKVFGCRQITKVFLNGHSNSHVRIIGLNFTPILDHVNLLEPEETLLHYSPLMIENPKDLQECQNV